MFRDASLIEAFEEVADEGEWHEFCQIRLSGDADVWIWVFSHGDASRPPCPRERAVLRYRKLWAKFACSVREKLLSGQWVAHGFNPQFGAHPVQIDSRLWRVLEFALGHDRAEGQGYEFANLSFSTVRTSSAARPHVERASLHRELVRWIEAMAASASGPMTVGEVREIARSEFDGTKISNHLFADAWRVANKPENFRQRGRPKTKVANK